MHKKKHNMSVYSLRTNSHAAKSAISLKKLVYDSFLLRRNNTKILLDKIGKKGKLIVYKKRMKKWETTELNEVKPH